MIIKEFIALEFILTFFEGFSIALFIMMMRFPQKGLDEEQSSKSVATIGSFESTTTV